ncbi:MAG: nagZ [Segetibacter sp.]|nr:nagZ [Segetibacter sp.]
MKKSLLYFLLLITPSYLFSQNNDSIQYKIGQMIMMGLTGSTVDTSSALYKDVKNGRVGGILIYEKHLTPTNTADNLQKLITAYQAASPTPLYVSIDQEGGLVNRLKTKYGFPVMPSAAYLGRINNIDTTKYYADNIAYTLSRLGINLNYAPVLDILVPTNPVLGSRERCYSSDPDIIVDHAAQTILSHNYFKVNSVVKHFPGHGSSTTDSHLGITDVSKTWNRAELKPYKDLIKQGLVDAVMTAHIVNTQLDSKSLPATLSKKIMTDLLRKELKFKGVIFSDDMHMKAISAEYGLEESIQMAINAGVDVLMFSGNIGGISASGAGDIVNIILKLLKEGKITEKSINASYERIMKMKNNRNNLTT